MSVIEGNIVIDLDDNVDASAIVEAIRNIVSSLNGKNTYCSISDLDDPMSLSPINLASKISEGSE